MKTIECQRCQTRMEEGFVVDRGHSNRVRPAIWVQGEPEASFWAGTRTRGKARLKLRALRCPKCGRVELYAQQE